ncbi:MAG: hypothetical protein ACU0DX_17015 [Roseovarius sp.]|uniref:hypothetical protein n=1 Tax=Roseovarius sp. TaxID=1486281 RepID=UPI004059246E
MTDEVDKRMLKALTNLNAECAYRDAHYDGVKVYIPIGKFGPDIGKITMSRLLEMGYVETGTNTFNQESGFRITTLGINALQSAVPKNRPKEMRKLRELKPHVRQLKERP